MRENKFRAWDKKSKKMREIDSIAFHGKGAFDQSTQKIKLINLWGYNVIEEKDVIVQREPKDVVLLEFTGLKDKNGKDVYEGDIIKCQQGCPHEVVWLEEYAGTYFGGMPAWYLKGLKEGYAWSGDEEIIGNIYEHPHVLKG